MNPNHSHIAGLELALQQWNNGGPSAHFSAQLRGLIEQAQQANHSEHDLNMVAPVSEAKAPEPVERVISKPQTCNGKRCGWCKEGAEPCHYAAPVVSAEQQGVPDYAQIEAKAREVFGWVSALGGFDDAVRDLANYIAGHRLAAAPAPSTTEGRGDD